MYSIVEGKNYLQTKMRRIIQRKLIKQFLSPILCKGGISRDFRFQVFILYESVSPGPLSTPFGPFRIFMRIKKFAEICALRNFVFTAGVGVNVSTTLATSGFVRWCIVICLY
jgi:hypothetical protein